MTAARPMHVLFVATLPEPGGAASHLVTLARALQRIGVTVTVIASPDNRTWTALTGTAGLTCIAATFRTPFHPEALAVVDRAVRERAPTHLVAVFEQDYWGTLRIARRHRLPARLLLHHAGMRRTNKLLLPLVRPTYVVPSEDLRRWIMAKGIPASRAQVLANPIDTAHFRPDETRRRATRAQLGFADDACVVGYFGRFEANKGIVPFAQAMTAAMARVPTLRALWVGFGRREAELDAITQQMPGRHVRLPWTDDPHGLYCATDLVALPSTGRESFGRVLVEAQACGVPVLGSDIGGIPDTMQPGVTGELVAPGDVAAWTAALTRLASDPAQRQRLAAGARDGAIARYSADVVARRFVDLLTDRA